MQCGVVHKNIIKNLYFIRYNLSMIDLHGRIKDSLIELKNQQPQIQAVVMGTRNTDPYSSKLRKSCWHGNPQYRLLSW